MSRKKAKAGIQYRPANPDEVGRVLKIHPGQAMMTMIIEKIKKGGLMRWILMLGCLVFISGNSVWGADTVDPGKKLFESKCAQCHGKDAKGLPKMAGVLMVEPTLIDLTRADAVKLPFEDKVKIVTNGKNKMLKFKKKLTDEQIQQVVKYVESLQGVGAGKKK